jgi:hypothetical protein
MAFSERIQQLCPGVNNEQAIELREFLVEASERLEAEPSLMGISLKTLEQEATDQGYAWVNVVMVLQEVATASSADGGPQQLLEAWQTCMASEGSVADFTAVLTDQFPEVKSVVVELVDEAKEEHQALSGLAGGTSSWRIDSSRTATQKKNARLKDVGEVATVVAGFGAVTYAINTYAAEKVSGNVSRSYYGLLTGTVPKDVPRQLWSTLDKQKADDLYYRLTGREASADRTLELTPKKRLFTFTTEFNFTSYRDAIGYQISKLNPRFISNIKKRGQQLDELREGRRIPSAELRSQRSSLISEEISDSGDTNDIINDMNSHRFNNFETDKDRFIDEWNRMLRGEPLQRRSFDHLFQRVRGIDLNPRRMSERIRRASGEFLNDGNDGLASLGGESDLSMPSLSDSAKTLPARMSAGLWDDAKNSVMSDLSLDMKAAEMRAARSASTDISGLENKELGLLEL